MGWGEIPKDLNEEIQKFPCSSFKLISIFSSKNYIDFRDCYDGYEGYSKMTSRLLVWTWHHLWMRPYS